MIKLKLLGESCQIAVGLGPCVSHLDSIFFLVEAFKENFFHPGVQWKDVSLAHAKEQNAVGNLWANAR